jgi:hypothetical protein
VWKAQQSENVGRKERKKCFPLNFKLNCYIRKLL